jgi:DNA segregation ATPase FtsK/SpoIIIE, S-DNA-T family
MAYSLDTLTAAGNPRNARNSANASASASATPARRFTYELALVLGAAALLFWLLALITHSSLDAAWSTSGSAAAGSGAKNWGGKLGAYLSDASFYLLGYSVWWCVLAGARSWLSSLARWLRGGDSSAAYPRSRLFFWIGLVMLLAASCALEWSRLYRLEPRLPGHAGGILGYALGAFSTRWLGFNGAAFVAIVVGVVGAAWALRFSWSTAAESTGGLILGWFDKRREKKELAQDLAFGSQAAREREETVSVERAEIEELHVTPVIVPKAAPVQVEPVLIDSFVDVPKSTRVAKERQKGLFADLPDSKLPQVDLLDGASVVRQETVSPETLEMTSRLIEKKLKDFGVAVQVVAAMPGPVITRYEIEPATGVKGSQVVNLAKDLARALSLVSIRVIETIPGKNYMALELPNAKRQTIKLSEILGSQVYSDAKSMLTIGLGKDIVGNSVVADLAKMPHCLVAGTTGSGKSVGINAMILSLLYKAEARDVRLLLIDPKMLEMSVYEGIPHLLAPVVTDMRQAGHGLNWCVMEMERRYKLMSKLGVRNLAGYNTKIDEAKAREEFIYNPFSLTPESPEPLERLPHIVVVIDELADLMMVVGKKIEELIARLAQKARAAGIHLILATQRPSVDVITGLIKANIPTRIAFQVSSKIDSRTILDQMGAEALLGMGDMLYMPVGSGFPTRVHGAFVSDEEVHRVVAYLKSQGEPNYIEGVLEGGTVDDEGGLSLDGMAGNSGESDPLYDRAVEVVLKNQKASISLVQRHLTIGYNKAANLLEAMEKAGLVSSMDARGKREILVPMRGGGGGAEG